METDIQIASVFGAEKIVMAKIDEILLGSGCVERDRLDIKTAAVEACLNAIEHGNGLNPRLNVNVHIRVTDNEITIEVYDQGPGAELHSLPPDLTDQTAECRGWGLFFIDNLVDAWNYSFEPPKNQFCMRMTKKFSRSGDAGWNPTN